MHSSVTINLVHPYGLGLCSHLAGSSSFTSDQPSAAITITSARHPTANPGHAIIPIGPASVHRELGDTSDKHTRVIGAACEVIEPPLIIPDMHTDTVDDISTHLQFVVPRA